MTVDADLRAMARALALAERGRGRTRPNPLVGCVLVRGGAVVGAGWHERPGGPHAEVAALGAAGDAADGASAYVTLEPCAHTGRTPPCTDALIDAGVARVVYGLADPNPVAGGGHRVLAAAGVEVEGGLLADWVARQNLVYLHALTARRPHLTLKLAQTVDGSLRVPDGGWITGEAARRAVHRMRRRVDAVLVGSGTVLADDPRLTVRHVEAQRQQPRPVVLDARGRIPPDAAVVRPGAVIITTPGSQETWRAELEGAGAEVVAVPPARTGGVSLPHALAHLFDRDVRAVLAEPGPTLSRSLVRERLVDRLVLHVAVGLAVAAAPPRTTPCAAPGRGWRWRVRSAGPAGRDRIVDSVPVAVPADGPADVPAGTT